ncbi:hypothetical protein B0A55_11245 [Friedmanniomyces simplex]|uniref:Uncharacterized protein n=1 Tax=Friedmanniomyces simplex TaxID=329884 RepID=A0A4U0WGD5_9PEZI|nr:hypothetical protein B0A55_11245 [Friedmanniomyces simplex]
MTRLCFSTISNLPYPFYTPSSLPKAHQPITPALQLRTNSQAHSSTKSTMSAHTTTNPTTETPSSSETRHSSHPLYPKESVSAAEVSTADSKVGMTSNQANSTTSNQPGSAEAAADKLYEERIEEEYAKREGGA